MSTRTYARRRGQQRLVAAADVASEHPFVQPGGPSPEQETISPANPTLEENDRLTHDFGQVAVQPSSASLAPQMKQRVSQPGEPHEQEADRIADAVTQASDSALMSDATPTASHASSSGGGSGGQALDTATRAYMEPRFGHDFSQVRVHTDEQAAQAAADYQARAYTVGGDIVFGAGEYAPGTHEGQRLIAHELTHVVQQQGDTTAASTVQRDPVETPLPDTSQVMGKKVAPEQMKDGELADGVLHRLHGILTAWQSALGSFYVVLASSSDKEARPNFPSAMLDFLREEAVGEIIPFLPLKLGESYKFLMGLGAEDKRAQAAQDSAKLRDFVVTHQSAIGDILTQLDKEWDTFLASVRITTESMEKADEPSSTGKKGKGKGKWGVETSSTATRSFDDYWTMHMVLIDTFSALGAQADFSTAANLFRLLSEEWLRGTMVKEGWGTRHARIIIRLNKDFSVKDAHIEGTGGQKIAEQLIKDADKAHLEGVDLYNMRVRKEVQYYGADMSYPSAYVKLDEDNIIRDYVRGDEAAATVWDYIKANGAKAFITKKIDGD